MLAKINTDDGPFYVNPKNVVQLSESNLEGYDVTLIVSAGNAIERFYLRGVDPELAALEINRVHRSSKREW